MKKSLCVIFVINLFVSVLIAEETSPKGNEDMPISILDQLSKDLKPYALYQITITMSTGTTAKRVEVYTRNEQDKERAIEVLKKYENVIDHYSVYERFSMGYADFSKLRISSYKQALKKYLRSVVAHIEKNHPAKDLYAFSVALSVDHHTLSVHWNTESEFQKTLKNYQERNPDYSQPKRAERLKYAGADFKFSDDGAIEGFDDLSDIFEVHQNLNHQLYDRHGDHYLTRFSPAYESLMTNATVAVMLELEDELRGLSEDEDFIFYLEYWDKPGEDHFNALQLTVPEKKIKKLLGLTYAEFLK